MWCMTVFPQPKNDFLVKCFASLMKNNNSNNKR